MNVMHIPDDGTPVRRPDEERGPVVVTAATSATGSAVVRALLDAGSPVLAVGRDHGRLRPYAERGAHTYVSALDDPDRLTAALAGATGAFVMLAPGLVPDSPDFAAYQRAAVDAQARAVREAFRHGRLRRVVTLSGWAAGFPGARGPVWGLRRLEEAIDATGVPAVHLRVGWFMENLLADIDAVRRTGSTGGILPPDLSLPMTATADIGRVAAELLRGERDFVPGPVEVAGPAPRTLREATRLIGEAVGAAAATYAVRTPAEVRAALVADGFSGPMADGTVAMTLDVAEGRIRMLTPGRRVTTPTTLERFLAAVTRDRPAPASPVPSTPRTASTPHGRTRMTVRSPRQAPGFQRFRLGDLLITALYDGYVPILADDLRGAPGHEIRRRLTDAFLPEEGDPRTAVLAFLVEHRGTRVLVDAGSGATLGPDTGHLPDALSAAGTAPEDVEHVLITHLHPDHSGGLVTEDGAAVYPRATVHVARAEADHWLDPERAARAEGVAKVIHEAAASALAPYRRVGRVDTFDTFDALPGVRALDQRGHTAGHSGYLFEGERPVLFWGDTVHSHTVQLPCPHVSVAIDSDEPRAVEARARVLGLAADGGWWVAAAHLPFPGLGRLRRDGDGYDWVPVPFGPLVPSGRDGCGQIRQERSVSATE
ncbi:MBL fold metallo-hydrolase [Streptomyces sp. NPDC026672]|uniref:MBL fold metallo-hydrolase n=1 Tax=unclassified Streptomyces TaxID=2593676 RepID=UPI0033C39B59